MSLESPDAAKLMDHEYDGIREYDNPLPGWWRMIFAGSIAFACAYGFYFHIANWGTSPDAASGPEITRTSRCRADR